MISWLYVTRKKLTQSEANESGQSICIMVNKAVFDSSTGEPSTFTPDNWLQLPYSDI